MDKKQGKQWPGQVPDSVLSSALLGNDLVLSNPILKLTREINSQFAISNAFVSPIDGRWNLGQTSIGTNLGLSSGVLDAFQLFDKNRVELLNTVAIPQTLTVNNFAIRQAVGLPRDGLWDNIQVAFEAAFSANKALGAGFARAGIEGSIFTSLRAADFGVYHNIVLSDFALGSAAIKTIYDVEQLVGIPDFLGLQRTALASAYSGFVKQMAGSAFPAAFIAAGLNTASTAVEYAASSFIEMVGLPQDEGLGQWVEPSLFPALYRAVEAETGMAEPDVERWGRAIPVRLTNLALEIVNLWGEIGMLSETSTGEPIFKPTLKTTRAAGLLGLVVVSSREQFEGLADDLFYFLYEASADWKRVKPYVPDFPKVADRIKQLRLYKAHDTQHGDQDDIKRKALQVGNHLEDLTGQRLPKTAEDWGRAQIVLLTEVAVFLRDLRDAIIQSRPQA